MSFCYHFLVSCEVVKLEGQQAEPGMAPDCAQGLRLPKDQKIQVWLMNSVATAMKGRHPTGDGAADGDRVRKTVGRTKHMRLAGPDDG